MIVSFEIKGIDLCACVCVYCKLQVTATDNKVYFCITVCHKIFYDYMSFYTIFAQHSQLFYLGVGQLCLNVASQSTDAQFYCRSLQLLIKALSL